MTTVDRVRSAILSTGAGRAPRNGRPFPVWPIFLLALPAFVAIWSGWVSLGEMCGFGIVHPFPGIADHVTLNTAITLPIGLETYAAYALGAWLSGRVTAGRARQFAKWSSICALAVGATGQITYHLMAAAHWQTAPWPIVMVVSCIPVVVLGLGTALAHLLRDDQGDQLVDELPEAPVSPAGATFEDIVREQLREVDVELDRPRTPAELVAAADRVKAAHPGWTSTQVAAAVGRSDRWLRQCRKLAAEESD